MWSQCVSFIPKILQRLDVSSSTRITTYQSLQIQLVKTLLMMDR